MIIRILILLLVCIIPAKNYAANTLLDFNNGYGTTITGWTYYDGDPVGANDYGSPGWRKDDGQFYSGGTNWYPRIFNKTDYSGTSQLQEISTTERAPSTSTGGSLHVYDLPDATFRGASQWISYLPNYSTSGYADSSTNRMSFYIKFDGLNALNVSGPTTNFHLGTYSCWTPEYNCSNSYYNHYYHYFAFPDDMWIHVDLDDRPTHSVGGTAAFDSAMTPDPFYVSTGHHYFESMTWSYYEIRASQIQSTEFWLDEIELYTANQEENNISISSLWIGYLPSTGKWQVGFQDTGSPVNSYGQSSFEIRWSVEPITSANWDSATEITPEYFRNSTTNKFTNQSTGYLVTWTQFDLPPDTETNNDIIYFALKDVSSIAAGDGRDTVSSLVRTINYTLSAQTLPVGGTGHAIYNASSRVGHSATQFAGYAE